MSIFKDCPNCGKIWQGRIDFLTDPDVAISGYQAHLIELRTGLFLFNHSCRATLALQVDDFIDLHDGPVFSSRKAAPADCPRYCLDHTELRPCPVQCDCHFVREIIQTLKNWPKRAEGDLDPAEEEKEA